MAHPEHLFIIPVMGTGYSLDTAIRVAPFGIPSVISLVDDLLMEKVREHYSVRRGLPYQPIPREAEDGRSRRITAYLDLVDLLVRRRLDEIRAQPFFKINDKSNWFELLPDTSPLSVEYHRLLAMKPGPERDRLAADLTARMCAGDIDVNIMVKLDRVTYDTNGNPLGEEHTDARTALRGFARSGLRSCVELSAGLNQPLFGELARHRAFYRGPDGEPAKRIALKVSDFRSAMVQSRMLAKKGLEVYEYRIESGLNCGGHCFPTNGVVLPCVLQEFKEKRRQLADECRETARAWYRQEGLAWPDAVAEGEPLVCVQGGLGTSGEVQRLMAEYGVDRAGWASPFLLVPEATVMDDVTREQLRQAGPDDLYLSNASPLSLPFRNLRGSGSEAWAARRIAEGASGSPCAKGFLVNNKEFTEKPICVASRQYHRRKAAQVNALDLPEERKADLRREYLDKQCICDHLGNSLLIALGLSSAEDAPQSICPGPNIAWFNSLYTLREMVDHIYGRGPSLVAAERPHVFAQEIVLYVDWFLRMAQADPNDPKEHKRLTEFLGNLEGGLDSCLKLVEKTPFPHENLASIAACVHRERTRLREAMDRFEARRRACPAP